jgi:epsilon-lactone hydrolase
MPSQAMQHSIDALRDRRQASAGQATPTPQELRATFTPGDRLHPVPDDVLVSEVEAGGVPAHWLAAPGTDAGRVLLFMHWLRTDQGLSARSVAVAGDSAGGGLAVALLVAARDAGEALPAAAREVPARPGSLTRQSADSFERQ